jgi:zinc transporter, ZIP family
METEWLIKYYPVVLALFAILFMWSITISGLSLVLFFRNLNRKILNSMLGFAVEVVIAVSLWSFLVREIEITEAIGVISWLAALAGFLLGGACLLTIHKPPPHSQPGLSINKSEGSNTSRHQSILPVLAITFHIIPLNLAFGVASGMLAVKPDLTKLSGPIILVFGKGLQIFPKEAAVSIPLKREGFSRLKSFNIGQI